MDAGADETFLYKAETYAIRGAVFHVYRAMGAGFLEAVYQECLEREFLKRQIPFEARRSLPLEYEGEPSGKPTSPTSFALIGSSWSSKPCAPSRPSIGRN